MIDVLLREFLVHASLGPIKSGITPEEVAALCGLPEDVSVSRKPRIWKYGSLQIAFDDGPPGGRLYFLGIYFRDAPIVLPGPIVRVGWWPSVDCTPSEFLAFSEDRSLHFREHPPLTFDDQVALVGDAGVVVVFASDDENRMVIDSIQYADRVAEDTTIDR